MDFIEQENNNNNNGNNQNDLNYQKEQQQRTITTTTNDNNNDKNKPFQSQIARLIYFFRRGSKKMPGPGPAFFLPPRQKK